MFKLIVPFVLSVAVAMPADAEDFTWRGFGDFLRGAAHRNDGATYDAGTRRTGWGQDMPAGYINSADARKFVGRVTLEPNTIGATIDLYNRDVADQEDVRVVVRANGFELFREIYHMDKSTNGKRREIHIPEFAYEGKGNIKVVVKTLGRLPEASAWWGTATPNCEPRRTAPILPPPDYSNHKAKDNGKHSSRNGRDRSRNDHASVSRDRSNHGGKHNR